PQAQTQTQTQNHLGMLFNSSSAGPSTASNSASQISLGPRNSLSYGAAAMPRASISLLANSSNGNGNNVMGSGPVSRSSTVNRTTGMAALVPTTSNADSALVPMLYGFEGDNSTTLTVCAGDRVRVTEADSDGSGWTEVVLGSGQQGLVPTSYIDMSAYRPTPQTVPAGRALMPPPTLAQNHSPSAGPNNLSLIPVTASSAEHVVALYDFAGRDTDELSFNAGDRIRVVSRDIGEGWLQGALGGREGRLPVSYVENA
ncbi:Protein BZZ1, partial [Kickxella alabastrina]